MTLETFYTVRGITRALRDEFKLTCRKRRETIGHVIADLMIDYVAKSGYETGLWPGFTRVKWAKVGVGQEVYRAGALGGEPTAFGPHVVIDPALRILRNIVGENFEEREEVILVKN